jgi:hypothetical protein
MKSPISMARAHLIIGLGLLLVAGCDDRKLESRWADREMVIDGTSAEWDGAITYFPESRVAVGVQNDEDYLYVSLVTTDARRQLEVLGRGAVVWFDPHGGQAKPFGIRFPLGASALGMGDGLERRIEPGERPDLDQLIRMYQGTGAQLEILVDKEVKTRVPVEDVRGIEVAINEIQSALVYEIKVPLSMSAAVDYAVGTKPGDVIGLGLETSGMDPEAVRERMPEPDEDMDPGNMGERRGPPGHGRDLGDRPMQMPQPVDFWAKVQLAMPPEAAP